MKPQILSVFFILCAASDSFGLTTILESASLNPFQPQLHSLVIVEQQYLGARFHINEPTRIEEVGGLMRRFASSSTVSIFAAITEIGSTTGFPTLPPLDFQPLAVTNFDLTTGEYRDWRTPLNVTLLPGDYSLIFGTGRFGVSGRAVMFRESQDTAQASYFAGSKELPDGRKNLWINDTPLEKLRFVVMGTVVPEPTSIMLIASLAFFVATACFRYRV